MCAFLLTKKARKSLKKQVSSKDNTDQHWWTAVMVAWTNQDLSMHTIRRLDVSKHPKKTAHYRTVAKSLNYILFLLLQTCSHPCHLCNCAGSCGRQKAPQHQTKSLQLFWRLLCKILVVMVEGGVGRVSFFGFSFKQQHFTDLNTAWFHKQLHWSISKNTPILTSNPEELSKGIARI